MQSKTVFLRNTLSTVSVLVALAASSSAAPQIDFPQAEVGRSIRLTYEQRQACRSLSRTRPVIPGTEIKRSSGTSYRLSRADTLGALAKKFYGSSTYFSEIAKYHNSIIDQTNDLLSARALVASRSSGTVQKIDIGGPDSTV